MRIFGFVLGFLDYVIEKIDPHYMLTEVHIFHSGFIQTKYITQCDCLL
jgi:hypothetical protein